MSDSPRPPATAGEEMAMWPVGIQWRRALPFLLWLGIPGAASMLCLLAMDHEVYAPVIFLRDPLSLLSMKFYTGIFTVIGGFFWCSTAAILWFTAAVVRPPEGAQEPRGFFLGFAALTTLLLLDDILLLHDQVLPMFLGLDERWAMGAEAVLFLFLAVRYGRHLLSPEPLLFLLSLCLLATSVAVDLALDPAARDHVLAVAEDGPKFLGILFWFSFFARRCHARLAPPATGVIGSPSPREASPRRTERSR